MLHIELNGQPPSAQALATIAVTNYGHFTSMQVRDGKVRGMALHLARLDDANEKFFGDRGDVDDELRLRSWIRHALGDRSDASVRVAYTDEGVLISVSDPVEEPTTPIRVRTELYERPWPEQKHSATMGLRYAQRTAREAGYDDALFIGPDTLIREGSTWNVAFWDGGQVVLPMAPMLKGVTIVLLQIAMSMTGIPWTTRPVRRDDLPDLLAAAAVNSHSPARRIAAVDDIVFDEHDQLTKALHTAWDTVPWDDI
ncbi:aminotransferase class IV [Actinoplanes sp. NPDC089786]|uniref:aminotransferase class IV n=1 Tax=Actinoplanes sp. NPDC089786 TaxID=3155185 RepID=UPI0034120986